MLKPDLASKYGCGGFDDHCAVACKWDRARAAPGSAKHEQRKTQGGQVRYVA